MPFMKNAIFSECEFAYLLIHYEKVIFETQNRHELMNLIILNK